MTYRLAEPSDVKLYFDWANDPEVRKQSHNTDPILWENHVKWFNKMLASNALMLIFFEGDTPISQLRVDTNGDIALSVDQNHRGKGVATLMLKVLSLLLTKAPRQVRAEVKQSNIGSINAFERSGFKLDSIVSVNGVNCNVYII